MKLLRNQAMRDANILKDMGEYVIAYYYMPNGARYVNRVKRDDTDVYTAISDKKLVMMCTKDPELREAVINMYHEHIEGLKDEIDDLAGSRSMVSRMKGRALERHLSAALAHVASSLQPKRMQTLADSQYERYRDIGGTDGG